MSYNTAQGFNQISINEIPTKYRPILLFQTRKYIVTENNNFKKKRYHKHLMREHFKITGAKTEFLIRDPQRDVYFATWEEFKGD